MRRTVAFGLLLTMLAASQFAVGEASAEKPNIQGSSTQAQMKKNCDASGRIHGTNQPSTIGRFVSSGCIRLTNDDIEDLYNRVNVGTRVVVLSRDDADSATLRPAVAR